MAQCSAAELNDFAGFVLDATFAQGGVADETIAGHGHLLK